MHAQETIGTITIKGIDTTPEHDPYVNLSGHHSYTQFWLNPRDRTCGVTQEYKDNATPIDEWNGLVLTLRVEGHPHPDTMREWIVDNLPKLERVCDDFDTVWDGSNMVGKLEEEAGVIWWHFADELENLPNYYEYWDVAEWCNTEMYQVTASTTDEGLQALAGAWEPDDNTVMSESIIDYITERRNNLRGEEEALNEE